MSDQERQEPPSRGYFPVPRQLRIEVMSAGINTIKLVYFIADETLGWASHWALLSYSDILTGCTWHKGVGSGLPNDVAISRAIKDALDRHLIEVRQTPGGTLYAIHRRFWVLVTLQPTWTIYKRLPYDETADPLTLEPVASIVIAQPFAGEDDNSASAITMLADAYPDTSKLLSPGKQPVITMLAQPLREASPEAGSPAANKALEENRGKKPEKESAAPSPLASIPEEREHETATEANGPSHLPFESLSAARATSMQASSQSATKPPPELLEAERRYHQQKTILNKRILDAMNHAKTARRIGKYAGWTEADWRYDEQEARRELAALEARYRQGDAS